MLLGLTGYQWTAIAIAPVFVWLWWKDGKAAGILPHPATGVVG
jgi:hypothetical protein